VNCVPDCLDDVWDPDQGRPPRIESQRQEAPRPGDARMGHAAEETQDATDHRDQAGPLLPSAPADHADPVPQGHESTGCEENAGEHDHRGISCRCLSSPARCWAGVRLSPAASGHHRPGRPGVRMTAASPPVRARSAHAPSRYALELAPTNAEHPMAVLARAHLLGTRALRC
jgi:hypothetical protein